jgi:hypothetical protein
MNFTEQIFTLMVPCRLVVNDVSTNDSVIDRESSKT